MGKVLSIGSYHPPYPYIYLAMEKKMHQENARILLSTCSASGIGPWLEEYHHFSPLDLSWMGAPQFSLWPTSPKSHGQQMPRHSIWALLVSDKLLQQLAAKNQPSDWRMLETTRSDHMPGIAWSRTSPDVLCSMIWNNIHIHPTNSRSFSVYLITFTHQKRPKTR